MLPSETSAVLFKEENSFCQVAPERGSQRKKRDSAISPPPQTVPRSLTDLFLALLSSGRTLASDKEA